MVRCAFGQHVLPAPRENRRNRRLRASLWDADLNGGFWFSHSAETIPRSTTWRLSGCVTRTAGALRSVLRWLLVDALSVAARQLPRKIPLPHRLRIPLWVACGAGGRPRPRGFRAPLLRSKARQYAEARAGGVEMLWAGDLCRCPDTGTFEGYRSTGARSSFPPSPSGRPAPASTHSCVCSLRLVPGCRWSTRTRSCRRCMT